MGPRDILNKLKWHPNFDLTKAEITIVHRGAPKDKLTFSGENIVNLDSGFLSLKREDEITKIPYHRILRIETPEKVLWEKTGR